MPSQARALTAHPCAGLSGAARVPGDKSISHRALLLAALAVGESEIAGLLEGEDVLRTAEALRCLGAEVERDRATGDRATGDRATGDRATGDRATGGWATGGRATGDRATGGPGACDGVGLWRVWGRGVGGLGEPERVLDMGNSGTGARLLMGLLAGHPVTAVLTGDASLVRRPMARVAEPLEMMGARFAGREGLRLPLSVTGTDRPLPIRYRLPVPSAQVKSAILLAGLAAPGRTEVIEPAPTRDHSERMLRYFGAEVRVEETGEGRAISLAGQPELAPRRLTVPADPSSAAFAIVAALSVPGSELRLPGVGLNPHRVGLFETLREMGAELTVENEREEGGEPLGDLRVAARRALAGIEVPAERAPAMIDEYPILAVAAACAEGRTVMRGLGELRVKESDRLAAVARGLAACGVEVEEGPDSLAVRGAGGRPPGGGLVETRLDHRIAMSFLVLGLAAERPVTVDDAGPIDTSFPGFVELMNGLGARIAPATGDS